MTRARFITFEGGDGAGKSTQTAKLAETLRRVGAEAVTTREPGGTEQGEAVRALLVSGAVDRWDARAEALLHSAARAQHICEVIGPALARGAWVVCDRFADSTTAYQGYGHGLDLQELQSLRAFATGGLAPGLTIILDTPAETGLARAQSGGEDRYERMAEGFARRVREGFLRIAEDEPERVRVIDAAGGIEDVHAACLAAAREVFGAEFPA
ncbi:MAG: dTMP kinase [Rhodospirillales bacterium]